MSRSSLTQTQKESRLQDRVILIINGLSERGRVMAGKLARQGSDIAIIASNQDPKITDLIRGEVQANGSRFLLLTPEISAGATGTFSQDAIQKVVNTLGRLDAFISFAGDEPDEPIHGRWRNPRIFDHEGLTKAALKHILTQKQI